MAGWNLNVQRMLDFIELNLQTPLTLDQVARRLGYSPWYCTRQFHRVLGLPFRRYLVARRLSAATLELRDTDARILDVALRWGFGSQEAFGRAFKRAYGLSPGAYRRHPVPLLLTPVRRVLPPLESPPMCTRAPQRITTSLQSLPAHRFLGLRDPGARDYLHFWERQAARPGLDCHALVGLLDSLPSRNGQIGGWFRHGEGQGYLYGIEVAQDYAGPVPEGLECTLIPAGDYVVFHHPPYDFEREDREVCRALHAALEAWDPLSQGCERDDVRPIYQRHGPDTFGQAFCLPVKRP